MAALMEGKLAPRELAETTAHLRDCADCRTIAGELARFEREESVGARQTAPRPAWWSRVAAAVAALALLVPAARSVQFRLSPMGALVAAAPREQRANQARLSRHPWARRPVASRGPTQTPEQLQVRGAAGRVLERTSGLDTAEARHAAGVAYLLIDQTRESVAELKRATARSNDARVWNDLAAALYAVGEERSYPDALAAADQAIALDPKLAEAYFNRALILEKMGHPADAAWKRYLEIDPSSEWSNEARAHLARPKKHSATDPAAARRRVEGQLLGQWADAELRGDGARALAALREAAAQLAARTGDTLIADAVAAIDRTTGAQRRALAEAHRLYGEARSSRDLDLMRRAEAAFRAAGSPMAESAAFYVAVVQHQNGENAAAVRQLEELLTRVDPRRHRSLAAGVHNTLANCAAAAAEWGTVLREATLASAAYTEIGETANAGFANGFAATALDRLGLPEQAWKEWGRAFAATHDDPDKRLAMVRAAAKGLAATQRYDAAAALLDEYRAGIEGAPFSAAALFIELARNALETGDGEAAERMLGEARAAARNIEGTAERKLAEERIDLAEGIRRVAADPRAALPSLDRGIAFFSARKHELDLADAHFQRGRAFRAAGDDEAALADYRTALRHVEAKNIVAADAAAHIVDETVDLHLERGDGRAAFALADRAHGALADADLAAIPAGTALVEYMLLPRRVAIFCLTREGLATVTVSAGRRELAERVASLAADVRGRSPEEEIRRKAGELHRLLVAPVQSRLADVDELVLVPDRELQRLPFAVLFDGRRHLVERYAIRYAPSAARVESAPAALSPAVAIADPAVQGWPALPFSRAEAEQVAAVHGGTMIAGADATRARFLDALQRSALVHYAGHADSNARTYGALLLAGSAHDSGLLSASEIARLPLHERRPLVVLSACGTLRGEERHVAGMPTLARAFLAAGARGVVGTQWEVEDDLATELFVHFHKELRAGQAPARALRTAQMAMLQTADPRHRHPAAWSAVAVLSNV